MPLLKVTSCVVVAVYRTHSCGCSMSEVTLTARISKGAGLSIALLTEARIGAITGLCALGVGTRLSTRIGACYLFAVRVPACIFFGALSLIRAGQGTGRVALSRVQVASLAKLLEAGVRELLVCEGGELVGSSNSSSGAMILCYTAGRSLALGGAAVSARHAGGR